MQVGLFVTVFIGNTGTWISNFGTGRGYNFQQEDRGHMSRSYYSDISSVDLDFEEVEQMAYGVY
ncbi:MAG: hypothetical protein U5N58_06450 [Actinomycetota bacterium]|nr:hypothetical protein [Actinomycetota bacterium]